MRVLSLSYSYVNGFDMSWIKNQGPENRRGNVEGSNRGFC